MFTVTINENLIATYQENVDQVYNSHEKTCMLAIKNQYLPNCHRNNGSLVINY